MSIYFYIKLIVLVQFIAVSIFLEQLRDKHKIIRSCFVVLLPFMSCDLLFSIKSIAILPRRVKYVIYVPYSRTILRIGEKTKPVLSLSSHLPFGLGLEMLLTVTILCIFTWFVFKVY